MGSNSVIVWWNEPSASDESGRVSSLNITHRPGSLFGVGVTTVSYTFMDRSTNSAICKFNVTVLEGNWVL